MCNLLGRDLQASDGENAPDVAIVNAALARKHFEGSPIGREFCFGSEGGKPIRIVGVAADAKYDKIRNESPSTIYLPWMQNLESAGGCIFNCEPQWTRCPSPPLCATR